MELTDQDFRQWLKDIKSTAFMRDADPYEIASLAEYVGFPRSVILPVLSHFESAVQGMNFENVTKWYMCSRMGHYTHGPFSLETRRKELRDYQVEGKEFEGGLL